MQLTISTSNGSRVINLHKEFFANTTVFNNRKPIVMTPASKAKELAEIYGGNNLIGYILHKNGKELVNFRKVINLPVSKESAPELRDNKSCKQEKSVNLLPAPLNA